MSRRFQYASLLSASLSTLLVLVQPALAEPSFFDRLQPAGSNSRASDNKQPGPERKLSAAEHINLAGNLRANGNADGAVNVLEKAHHDFPEDTDILKQLGIALIDAKRPVEAIEVFDVLAAMEPKNARAYNGKAVAFDTAGNHTAAIEIYEKALSLEPASVAIRNNMAMSKILNDQLDEAIAMLEILLAEAPEVPKIQQNLALAYGLKGNSKRALELNLQSLSQAQAEENLKFYQHYSALKKDYKPVDLMTQDGQPLDDLFTETPDKASAPTVNNVAAAPVEPDAPEAIKVLPNVVEASPASGDANPNSAEPAENTDDPLAAEEPAPKSTSLFGNNAEYTFPTGRRF